jgi:hypothetical protein
MVDISATVTVVDDASGSEAASYRLILVTSSEPQGGGQSKDISGFATGVFTDSGQSIGGQLRAARNGSGPRRVYKLTFQALDNANNVAISTATVTVPHNQLQPVSPISPM